MTRDENKEANQRIRFLHERHMQDGQDLYFSIKNYQLEIRSDQRLWFNAHLEKINRLLSLKSTDRFLDLGCGEGFFTLPLSYQASESFGFDFVMSAIKVIEKQEKFNPKLLSLAIASGDNIPIPGKSINKLLCNHVLEQVIDDDAAVREMYRIIKPNGLVLIGVPLALSYQIQIGIRLRRFFFPKVRKLQLESVEPGKLVTKLIGVQSHIRFYSLQALFDLLERNHFEVLSMEGVGISLPTRLRRLVRKNEILFKISIALGHQFPVIGDGVLILARRIPG
jgi:ubiquinone/menaquinone biosynthesis C-methylase UbiE